MAKKKTTKKIEAPKISEKEICNIFKITGYFRNFVLKKYKNQEFTQIDWEKNLKKDGLDF